MRFAIMTWVPTRDNADERTFEFAEETKKAIAQHGYYLLGAGETPSDAFGMSEQ
jgi:hypothetical protein